MDWLTGILMITIELIPDEVALCLSIRNKWVDVPSVVSGQNSLTKPEWTRLLLAVEANRPRLMTLFGPANSLRLAKKIMDAIGDMRDR